MLQDSELTQNTATPGLGTSGGGNGQGKGGTIFIHDDATATGSGNSCDGNTASDAARSVGDTLDFYGDGTGICPQPTVTINQAAGQSDPANTSPVNFTAVFNAPITGFTASDVTLGGTAGATTATITELTPNDGTTFNIAVSGMTTSGTVTASLAANIATDAAGNGNLASTSTDNTVTAAIDSTPPVITPNITGTLGNNGWYTSNVSVSWSVVDDESAISMTVGCNTQSVTTDTTGVTFTCSATSTGGTDSQSVTIKVDQTAPTLSCPGAQQAPATSPSGAVVTFSVTATDNHGPVSPSCTPSSGSTFPLGSTPVSCTATDGAGLQNSCSFSVTVTASAKLQLDGLLATVQGLPVPNAVKLVLKAPVLVAKAALQNNKPQIACGSLKVFEGIVKQLRQANKLTAAQATQLTSASQSIRAAIGCP